MKKKKRKEKERETNGFFVFEIEICCLYYLLVILFTVKRNENVEVSQEIH